MVLGAAVLAFILVPASAAQAFELFGIHLWGERTSASDAVVDPVRYRAQLSVVAGDGGLERDLERESLLLARAADPPSGTVGLLQRARDDQANLVGRLYEKGYFGALVNIRIGGRPIESISVTDAIGGGTEEVRVAVEVATGPVFSFRTVAVSGVPAEALSSVLAESGLVSGARASATTVRGAAAALVLAVKRRGHPFARITGQDIIADHAVSAVDVALIVTPGPVADIGAVTVSGADSLDAAFLLRQAEIDEGGRYSPDVLDDARKNLGRIQALGSVTVETAESLDADGRVPVVIEVSERLPRTFGIGGYYSSTDGPGAEAFWLHRNLFGEGETLRLEAEAGREVTIGQYDNFDSYNWRVGARFTKPGVIGPRVDWLLGGLALQEDTNPYFRRGAVFDTGLAYRLDDEITLAASLSYDHSFIEDAVGGKDFDILSLPSSLTYDGRNVPLDATSGVYATVLAEPSAALDNGSLYLVADAEARAYLALDGDERFVLAARARAGTVAGAGLDDVPAHRRFYAGGGGSVRGYDYLDVGPRSPGYGPTGGLSRVEGSLEARFRVTDSVGIVPFVDAGYVAETALLGGTEDFRWSAGLGLRYYTAVGPIRLDVAIPIDPREGDPDFAVYFGIGQSF